MSSYKILLTGATGYIGGSVLNGIIETAKDILTKHSVSVLIRGQEKVTVFEKLGVKPILFNSLDETDFLQKVASEHDIVIHTASGFHTAAAKALVTGLGDRKKQTGKEVHYIHTTGTSNLGDQPITGNYHEDHIFSDKENIFAYLKARESKQVYSQRTTDIVAIETGLQFGVQTHLIMSPTIYGFGTGLYNKLSVQIPRLIGLALKEGQAIVIGEGKGIWDYIHIADLVPLYILFLKKILNGEKVPGPEQIMFSSTGRFTWLELSQRIANALFQLNAIKTKEVKHVELEDVARTTGAPILIIELGFSSNSRTSSDLARELGWEPAKTQEDFENHFLQEAKVIFEAK